MKYKPATVVWLDAACYKGDHDWDKDFTPMLLVHSGILVEDTEEHIVLAAGINPEMEKFEHIHVIPKAYIQMMKIHNFSVNLEDLT